MQININLQSIKKKDKLSEDVTRYKLLYETSNDAIMTLAPPDWNFTSGNPATIKMFNAKDEKEFVATAPWKLSPKKQPDGQPSLGKAKKMIELKEKIKDLESELKK